MFLGYHSVNGFPSIGMMKLLICFGIGFVALAYASPAAEKKALSFESDPVGYVQEFVLSFLDGFLKKDNYEVGDIQFKK